MQPDLPAPNHGPAYRPWKRHFPTNEPTLRLLVQQWTCLPWVSAGDRFGAWLEKLHIKGTIKPTCAPLITALPIERRNGDSRVPFDCRPQPDPIRIEREARHLPSGAFRPPETIHPTIRALKSVRLLLSLDHRWIKHELATDPFGEPVDPFDPRAIRWSLRGAIEREATAFSDTGEPSRIIAMIHLALVRTARKVFPIQYRPAARAPRSARLPELVDRIHDARQFDHSLLLAWCEATLDALRAMYPPPVSTQSR